MTDHQPSDTLQPADAAILIVEDSRLQAEVMRRALDEAGYPVVIARNGATALELARAQRPLAIVSDVNMPVMDGYALCAAIRKDPATESIPVILVTTLSDPRDVMRGLQAGADAYLTKPCNIPSLLLWIGMLLAHPVAAAHPVERRRTEIWMGGEVYPVQVSSQRMMNLLASTYENAVFQNRELLATQVALEDLNATLEQRVQEQTAALRASERRLHALLEHASDLLIVVDADGLIRFAGPSIERICGFTPAELYGHSMRGMTHPDDWAAIGSLLSNLTEFPDAEQGIEHRIRCCDGRWITVESNARNALADPAVGGIVLNLRDITARKAAEEDIRKLSMAVEQSPESIMITDVDGRIEYVNEAFVRNTRYSRQEAIGCKPQMLHSGETPATTYSSLWEHLNKGQVWRGEFRNRRKDGSILIDYSVVAPLRQPDGTITHFISVQQDVTEQRAMEAELDQHRRHLEALVETRTAELAEARQRAEQANQSKSEFLASMSHEIRTPMNAIIGLTHMLRRSSPRVDQDERLAKISGAADHLLSVINDILDLSKIEAGKLVLEQADFDPEQVVHNVCNLIQDKAQARHLELVVDLRALPAMVRGDGLRVQQILLNFASNAVKFTEHGSISLRGQVSAASDSGMTIRFEVADTGIGLTEEQRSRLFRPFEQAEASTSRRFGGTGLGLSISRRMVDLMGGTIGVDSEPGQGSVFWIEIPVGFGELVIPERSLWVDMVGKRALVVDVLPETRDAVVDILIAQGMKVAAVADGRSTLTMVAEADAAGTPFDLLLVESILGEESGIDIGRRLQSMGLSRQPVRLLMTGLGEEVAAGSLAAAGYFDVLPKPVTPAGLFDPVQDALSGVRRQLQPMASSLVETTLCQRGGARILLAEDNLINQEVALDLLRSVGIEPDIADDGAVALEKVRQTCYELVLMDMEMPVMNGVEATRRIRELPECRSLPILAMTANAFDEAREACIAAGMNDHVAKPVNPQKLYTALLKWLPPREPAGGGNGGAGVGPASTSAVPPAPTFEQRTGFGAGGEEMERIRIRLAAIEGLDPASGLRNSNGRWELYLRLLGRFSENLNSSTLREALSAGDVPLAQRMAHTLKGVAGTLGATNLRSIAISVDAALKSYTPGDNLQAIADEAELLEGEFLRLAAAIQALSGDSATGVSGKDAPLLPLTAASLDVFAELERLVAADDIATEAYLRSHEPDLRPLLGVHFESFSAQIADYQFEDAVISLQAVRQGLTALSRSETASPVRKG